ncbi:hypothetical protein, partial [Cryobacterium roopkundense]|uniref:hypothetical protein n=1 Tax=Cryobacterium roopkundense TaxID=1001240 RepID=UPI001F22D8AA
SQDRPRGVLDRSPGLSAYWPQLFLSARPALQNVPAAVVHRLYQTKTKQRCGEPEIAGRHGAEYAQANEEEADNRQGKRRFNVFGHTALTPVGEDDPSDEQPQDVMVTPNSVNPSAPPALADAIEPPMLRKQRAAAAFWPAVGAGPPVYE